MSLPQVTPRVLTPLEPIQVRALAHAVPARYRVGVALGAGAGLRLGEATGLTVPRAQLLRRRVHVLEQAQNGASAPLKTKASRRVVPIGDWVIEEIAGHLEQFGPGAGQVIMSNAAKKIINRNAFGMMWRPLSQPRAPAARGPPMPMPRQSAATRAPTPRTSSRPGPDSTTCGTSIRAR